MKSTQQIISIRIVSYETPIRPRLSNRKWKVLWPWC